MRLGRRSCYYCAIAPSAIVLCLASAVAAAVTFSTGLQLGRVIQDYLAASVVSTFYVVILWLVLIAIRSEHGKLRCSVSRVVKRLKLRWPMLLLPALLSPLFLAAYTTAKTGIPFVAGFHWDGIFAEIDRALFRVDPWQITHSLFGGSATRALAKAYSIIWLVLLSLVQGFVVLGGRTRFVATFSSSLMLTWLVGGVGFAYLFSSAGPALAYAVDPAVGTQFSALEFSISHSAATADIALAQKYLIHNLYQHLVISGGGISAMPSMHIATVMIYVFAARGTRWFWPAVAFAVLIWVCSIHFGYHYAVDGPVAVVIAWGCWSVMARICERLDHAVWAANVQSPSGGTVPDALPENAFSRLPLFRTGRR